MAEQVIDQTVATEGDPAAVFALLADGSTWPEWSPIDSFALVEPGDGSPEGLGAVRLFTTGRFKSRERVVERTTGTCLLLRARGRIAAARLPGGRHAHPHGLGHHRALAFDLPGQGARDRLALPAPAREVHRSDGPRTRRRGGPDADALTRRTDAPCVVPGEIVAGVIQTLTGR